MSYNNFYNQLSKTEQRLFDLKYWTYIIDRDGKYPIVGTTHKWTKMIEVLFDDFGNEVIITQEMIDDYLDNPRKRKHRKTGRPKGSKSVAGGKKRWGKRTVKRKNKDGEMVTYNYDY